MDIQKHKLVIIGGGFASVKLARELGNDSRFEITLIAPHDTFEYHGALYRSANGHSPLEVVIPFREIFADSHNVNYVNDLLVELRSQTNEIKLLSGRTLMYDTLALGLGYEIEYYGIAGMRENSESMYTVFDTIKLRTKLLETFRNNAGKPSKIIVAGAGPTGVELASTMQHFRDLVCDKYGCEPTKLDLTLVDGAPRVLPMMMPEVSEIVQKELEKLNVKLVLGNGIKHCFKHSVHFTNGDQAPYDVIVWTAGSRGNPFFEKYPDLFYLEKKGRVAVNEYLQPYSPKMYVMGDCASTQYSGMAQTAIFDAIFVANDLRKRVSGEPRETYQPKEPAYIVPVGDHSAVVQNGKDISVGNDGWKARRDADLWVLQNFLPEKLAHEHWLKGEQTAQF